MSNTKFQFTPLREGRQFAVDWIAVGVYFNSRPSARGDAAPPPVLHPETYFNSRPSARGDPSRMKPRKICISFQFTPLREGRPGTPEYD